MKKNIIINILALSLLASCTSKLDFTTPSTPVIPPVTGNADLLISELSTAINTYTDSLGVKARNHYIELYNCTTNSINLSNYAIGYQSVTDTSTLVSWNFNDSTALLLSGTLASKKAYVIASPLSDSFILKSDILWGTISAANTDASLPLQLSGNSAIALLKKDATGTYSLSGNKYKIIDVFCSPLVARVITTGKNSARNNIIWAVGDTINDTRNRTFWRKPSVSSPQPDWNVANAAGNSQWEVSGDKKWDYTNIGLPTVK